MDAVGVGNCPLGAFYLLFCSGFEDLFFGSLDAFFSSVFELHGGEAGFAAGHYELEILKIYFHRLAFVVFEFHRAEPHILVEPGERVRRGYRLCGATLGISTSLFFQAAYSSARSLALGPEIARILPRRHVL
jgi:hypothetical protein